MRNSIDVTGLAPEAVRAVEALVAALRDKPASANPSASVFDLFGKAPVLRAADDIAAQLHEEREAWGEP